MARMMRVMVVVVVFFFVPVAVVTVPGARLSPLAIGACGGGREVVLASVDDSSRGHNSN